MHKQDAKRYFIATYDISLDNLDEQLFTELDTPEYYGSNRFCITFE